MSEAALWRALDAGLGHRGHFSRVESHETSAGIPDVDYCLNGVESHIELKFGRTVAPKIRPTSGKYWMLHKGATIGTHKLYTEKDLDVWQLCSLAMWEGHINFDELYGFLTINWSKK